MNRWAYTLDQRKYKCSSCLCLMGLFTRCLNTRCSRYSGALSKEN
jgi:hypothetical protein